MQAVLLALPTLFPLQSFTPSSQPLDPAILPRVPLAPEPVRAHPLSAGAVAHGHRLIVKFRDEVRGRATPLGGLTGATDLTALRSFAEARGLRFRSAIPLPEAQLRDLEKRAAVRSGRAQPDLAGMVIVRVPEGKDGARELEALGTELQARAEIEWASIETLGTPPPNDLAPMTSDYSPMQGYVSLLGADQLIARGFDGSGVRLSDCEYGWEYDHEDLNELDLHPEPGQTIHPNAIQAEYDEHGTAAVGEIVAMHNGYGMSGMAPGAEVYTYPEWTVEGGFRRLACVTNAIASSSAGDVVMLEMQVQGGGGFGPAELDLGVWTVTKTGTDAGVIVVGAAGNGGQNLDGPAYAYYRNRGDSGAIIVGSGDPVTRAPLGSSCHGTRVNLHGWGYDVATLGYGSLAVVGGDDRQDYASSFGGTSSATPMVATAAILLQGAALSQTGVPHTPLDLRDALIANGVPQTGTSHIGPFPDIPATLEALSGCDLGTPYCISQPNSTGFSAVLRACGSLSVAANATHLTAGGLPPLQPGLAYYGETQQLVPFGNGYRCVGGATGRLAPAMASGGGELSIALDITSPPQPAVEILPGSTWHFQAWYRDPGAGAGGFNLSQGVTLTFLP